MFQMLSKTTKQHRQKKALTSIFEVKFNVWEWVRKQLFSISLEEATFSRRGFLAGDSKAQRYLEQIGYTFLQGYHLAITVDQPEGLSAQLNEITTADLRGFAFEGAAMGLMLLDALTPWRRDRCQRLLTGAGADHCYMVYVGMGWALARLPWGIHRYLSRLQQTDTLDPQLVNGNSQASHLLDPLLGWLAIDGYGFHQGYFHWPQYIQRMVLPKGLSGYATRVFDQGLGRSMWFVEGCDINRIITRVRSFESSRRADLWSGIGLASAYAGGVDRSEIERLKMAAGSNLPQLAQGVAFAAKARQRAGNPTAHTNMACELLCGLNADQAADITDRTLTDLSREESMPAYEYWRQKIQNCF